MHTDRPLTDATLDRLGFEETALHLANAIMGDGVSSGFVFGIEGTWGSGKSSLINLTQEKLRKRPNSHNPQIIEYRPWLVGKREDLIKELFNQISGVVHNVVSQPHAGDARRLLRTYAQVASGLAEIASAAEVFEIPLSGKIKRALRSTEKKASEMAELSLSDIKDNLKDTLRGAKARIIIFIDDLDRLDPPEVVEVLRLVRAVADFPNVVYVTAYDADRIATHLDVALGTDDGGTYLEKVVQVSFRVPNPMMFDIVNWFEEEATRLLEVSPTESVVFERFSSTVQTWASILLKTPRDVVRARNALQLHAVPVQGQVDPGDMVFLQLIRIKFPALFECVEEYVVMVASIEEGMSLSREALKAKIAELSGIIAAKGHQKSLFSQSLAGILPGIREFSQDEESHLDLQERWSSEWKPFVDGKRLASKHHFRLYFSFSVPAGGISDALVDAFIVTANDDSADALQSFKEMAQEERPQGGVLAEVLLSRILERRDQLEPEDIPAIFQVLGEGMDVLAENAQPQGSFPRFLMVHDSSIFSLIRRLDEDSRKDVLKSLFRPGMSYSWLCGIIRRATTEHGLVGGIAKPNRERLLTTSEFEMIRESYLDMIQKEDPTTLLALPYLRDFLLSWQELGKKTEVREWVATQSKTDEGFLHLLESLGGSRRPQFGKLHRLNPSNLEPFFDDTDIVKSRIARLLKEEDQKPHFLERARKIHEALEDV